MYGPEPPPGFVDQPPSPPPPKKQQQQQQTSESSASKEADEATPAGLIIGPLPAEHRVLDELRHAARHAQAPAPVDKPPKKRAECREEWMLVPPEALAPSLMTAGRKRPAGKPDKSWTRIGDGQKDDVDAEEDESAEDAESAAKRRQQAAFEMESARLHDAEMERLAAATGSGDGGESQRQSLLQQHRDQLERQAKRDEKERKKKKKEEKKQKKDKKKESKKKRSRKSSSSSSDSSPAGPSRVPFNRETDLAIKGLDSKVKQSIVAKSQAGMASRFSHGCQKYL